jgi:hypothetical protein
VKRFTGVGHPRAGPAGSRWRVCVNLIVSKLFYSGFAFGRVLEIPENYCPGHCPEFLCANVLYRKALRAESNRQLRQRRHVTFTTLERLLFILTELRSQDHSICEENLRTTNCAMS